MCGIAGIFDPIQTLTQEDAEACKIMSGALVHRGPNESGFHAESQVVLAHRRLSIIDLSTGQQPMQTTDRKISIVFNGEIYNYRNIRQELIQLGHTFHTKSDTETLLLGYREWGRDVVKKLSGMFAFVVHDATKNLIFGARDPIGKKPLYYHLHGTKFSFASELGAMSSAHLFSGQFSTEGMELYFALGYVPAPYTLYEGVCKLKAAEAFFYSSRGLETWSYWDCSKLPKSDHDVTMASQHLEGLLNDAVTRRQVSEVPLGAFLSGGVDSNLVVSILAKISPTPVKTYTVGFSGKAQLTGIRDERANAAHAAAYYSTMHEEIELESQEDNLLPSLIGKLCEPLADPSILPTYLVCRAARKKVTVALTGDGGDEPFGGYSFRYLPHLLENKIRGYLPKIGMPPIAKFLSTTWPSSSKIPRILKLNTLFRNLAVQPLEAFLMDQSPRRPGNEIDSIAKKGRRLAFSLMQELYERTSTLDELTRLLYVDTRLYMCENVLVKADRMSMANSLELRSPLLDQSIIEYAFSLPATLKIVGKECKFLLRQLAQKKVDPNILTLPKTGFSFPVESLMRIQWRLQIEQAIFTKPAPWQALFSEKVLRQAWNEFLKGENRHQQFIWTVYVFALWYRLVHVPRFNR